MEAETVLRITRLETDMATHESQIELLALEVRNLRAHMDRGFRKLDHDMTDVKSSLKQIIDALAL